MWLRQDEPCAWMKERDRQAKEVQREALEDLIRRGLLRLRSGKVEVNP
jgi:hypothetical protein